MAARRKQGRRRNGKPSGKPGSTSGGGQGRAPSKAARPRRKAGARTAARTPRRAGAAVGPPSTVPAPDPRQLWIQLLRSVERAHGAAPEIGAQQRAVYDAWARILKDRVARVRERLSDLASQDQWVFDAQDRAVRLTGSGWREALHQQLGVVHASLSEALGDYRRVRVRWERPTLFGMLPGTNAGLGSDSELEKQRQEALKELAKSAEAQRKAYEATLAGILADWTARRAALAEQEAEFRAAYLATMRAEEAFLSQQKAPAAPAGSAAAAAAALTALRRLRLDLQENLDWHGNLRAWREQRVKARRALGVGEA